VSAIAGVLAAAKAMLPFCVKKAGDLRTLIDYMEGRISGNEAIEEYNTEIKTRQTKWVSERALHTMLPRRRTSESKTREPPQGKSGLRR
jgi:tRNA A37 N6-isopentenylltransferase MiaA